MEGSAITMKSFCLFSLVLLKAGIKWQQLSEMMWLEPIKAVYLIIFCMLYLVSWAVDQHYQAAH